MSLGQSAEKKLRRNFPSTSPFDRSNVNFMKKFFIVLGVIFAVVIAVIGIVLAIFIPRALRLDREAKAYIQESVPNILVHWNSQELVDRATPKLLEEGKSRDNIDKIFVQFQKLGSFKSLGTLHGSVGTMAFSGEGVITVGNYTADADFEKGPATIKIQLQRTNDSWRINAFYINSPALLAPQN
jgi:hypothetical protein